MAKLKVYRDGDLRWRWVLVGYELDRWLWYADDELAGDYRPTGQEALETGLRAFERLDL